MCVLVEPLVELKTIPLDGVKAICKKVLNKYHRSGYRKQCVVTVDDLLGVMYLKLTKSGSMNPDGSCVLPEGQLYSACYLALVDLGGKWSGARRVKNDPRGKWVDAPMSLEYDAPILSEEEVTDKQLDLETKIKSLRKVLHHLDKELKEAVEAWIITDGRYQEAATLLGWEYSVYKNRFGSAIRALRRMVSTGEYAALA